MEDKIACRPAKLEDSQEILDLDPEGSIYDGNDYLPLWMMPLMQDPASNHFVLTVNGKIACYTNWYVIEEGAAVIGMSTRTHPKYERRRFVEILFEYCSKVMLTRYPNLKRKLSSSRYQFSNKLPPNYKVIFRENVIHLYSSREVLKQNLAKGVINIKNFEGSTWKLPTSAAIELLTNDNIMKKFFNYRYILGYEFWWPTPVNKPSLRHLALRHEVVATFNNLDKSVLVNFPPSELAKCCTDVSYALILKGVKVYSMNVFYFGSSEKALLTHVVLHSKQLANTVPENATVGILLHFPLKMANKRSNIENEVAQLYDIHESKVISTVCLDSMITEVLLKAENISKL